MSCTRKDPLRPISQREMDELRSLSRSNSEAACVVAHAKEILAVADGATYAEAALLAGRSSRHMVSQLVGRFNGGGVGALFPSHAGGRAAVYGPKEKERILAEFRRAPERDKDGTSTWSIDTLKSALRQAPDGLPDVGHEMVWETLHEAGYTWQRDRSWCTTGTALRHRKSGSVEVTDPDAQAKKN